jgi:guanylate kinase
VQQGKLYIIAAPSGCGKTSLVNALVARIDKIKISISHTTRPKRPAEVDGENYFFISEAEFLKRIEQNMFIEYAKVFENYYGTSKQWLTQTLAEGEDVILEIDWQGARQIRTQFPDCRSIFILPPSLESLEQRLSKRGQDGDEVIAKRMAQARSEISHCHEFDYWLVNEDFDLARQDLETIVHAERLHGRYQKEKYHDLVQELLA